MQPETPTDFWKLLQNVREGDWVAISRDGYRVVSTGNSMEEVLQKADEQGEKELLVLKKNLSSWIFFASKEPTSHYLDNGQTEGSLVGIPAGVCLGSTFSSVPPSSERTVRARFIKND